MNESQNNVVVALTALIESQIPSKVEGFKIVSLSNQFKGSLPKCQTIVPNSLP